MLFVCWDISFPILSVNSIFFLVGGNSSKSLLGGMIGSKKISFSEGLKSTYLTIRDSPCMLISHVVIFISPCWLGCA